jgi:putative membrane protein
VPASCLALFLSAWVGLGIAPRYRMDWVLENLLTVAGVAAVIAGYRRFRFSDAAYVQGTVFLLLHTIGSHYTYSEVPLGDWARDAFGWSRNHYDRLVHFAFGILMLRPIHELAFRRRGRYARSAELFLAVSVVGSVSLVYEVIEWLVAIIVDPDAGAAFLGVQGDVWDCQKDMLLACAGGALSAIVAWGFGGAARLVRAEPPSVPWRRAMTAAGAAVTSAARGDSPRTAGAPPAARLPRSAPPGSPP